MRATLVRGSGSGASETGRVRTLLRRHTWPTVSGNRSTGVDRSRHAPSARADHIQWRRVISSDSCMGVGSAVLSSQFMGKYKPARGKAKTTRAPQGGLPCVILVILGMVLVMLFLYFVMRNANG